MAADAYTLCRTVLLLSRCLGLAPFSLAGNVGSRCLQTSVFGILYSITFPVVLLVLALCWSEIWHIKPTMCDVSAGAIYFIIILHFMISFSLCLLKRQKIINIARQLSDVNASLKCTCECVWKRLSYILSSQVCITLVICLLSFIFEKFILQMDMPLIVIVANNLLNFSCFVVEFQLVSFFMLLKQLISDMNKSISGLYRTKDNRDSACSCSKSSHNNTVPLFVTSFNHRIQNSVVRSEENSLKTRVILLRDVQDSLCGSAELLNSTYSFLLLYTTAKTFICLTHSLYNILRNVFLNRAMSHYPVLLVHSHYLWFVFYAGKLLWLLFYSSSTIQEVRL
jgi:hypothetical protein